MSAEEIIDSTKQRSISAFNVIKQSFRVIGKHPQLMLYPYTALLFISITYPLLSGTFVAHWYNRIFSEAGAVAPHRFGIILSLLGFLAFYTAFISAYFTTAVSAAVLATLKNENPSNFYGLWQVLRHFGRVTKFAVLALFFFPMGIYAQRKKLPHGIIGILGSSATLHMAQVAPAILGGHQEYGATIREATEKLGKTWKEGLILKTGMYITIFIVFVAPKLIQHHWYKSQTASNVGWLLSLEAGASSIVFFKVINAIFTTVLYHRATQASSQ